MFHAELISKGTLPAISFGCAGWGGQHWFKESFWLLAWIARRECVLKQKYEGCFQCDEFPCGFLDKFPLPFAKVAMRAVPAWRELGAEGHMETEYMRHKCPQCGCPLFTGATRCRICREPVKLD